MVFEPPSIFAGTDRGGGAACGGLGHAPSSHGTPVATVCRKQLLFPGGQRCLCPRASGLNHPLFTGAGEEKIKVWQKQGVICAFEWSSCAGRRALKPPPLGCVSAGGHGTGQEQGPACEGWRQRQPEQIFLPSSSREVQPEAGEPIH